MLDVLRVRQLCIRNNWFTGGSNAQYEKMFHLVETNAPITQVAVAIWLCTPNVSKTEIESKLRSISF